MNRALFLLFFVATLQVASLCEAAARVTVRPVPGATGTFIVEAFDFVDVGGVEVELSYDTAALANPRIAQGEKLASTMFVPNPKFKANVVKIAAMSLSPIKGSGTLAILTFDLKGSSPGNVAVSSTILASTTGSGVPTQPTPTPTQPTPTPTPTQPSSTPSSTPTQSDRSEISGISGISMGTVTLPQDQLATSGEKKSDSQPLVTDLRKDMTIPLGGSVGAQGGEKGAAAPESKPSDKGSVAYKSVLQLFKELKGEKTPGALISLFADAAYPDFRQEPAIVVSDGVQAVRLTLKLKPSSKESPKFILQGANVQQLRGEGEDFVWVVDAVPKKGVHEAKLTVIDGQRTLQFPLTVAPFANTAVGGGAKTTEADFAHYLTLPAKFDLNKDGAFDHLDDYIFTANYIVALKIKPEKKAVVPKKEAVKTDGKDDKKKAEPAKPVDAKPAAKEKGEKPAVKPAEEKPKASPAKSGKKPVKKAADKQEEKKKPEKQP